jgi:hypothetical protein
MGDPIAAAAAGPQKTRTISIDPESGGVRTRTESEFISRDGDELLYRSHSVNEFFLEPLDPLSAEATCLSETAWKQDGALCSLCLASTLTSTAEAFLHTVRLTAHLDEQELTDREFAYTIPRDFC